MSDRKKIIKGVHDARRYLEDREWVDKSVGVYIDALIDALALLKEQEPSADAEPVRHGRWVMDPHDGDVRCSVCRIAVDQMHERFHKLLNALTGGKWYTFYCYCPHCGAKMDLPEVDDAETVL